MPKTMTTYSTGAGNPLGASPVQVKVSVKPEVATAFKVACAVNDVSMTSALSAFMIQYANIADDKRGYSANLSTRRQRRTYLQGLIRQLERVRNNEELYRDNIPDNLQNGGAYEAAERCVSVLDEALDLLASAY